MDHGIAGGLMLYESLVRRHLKQRGNLGREDLDLYSYAANTNVGIVIKQCIE